MKNLFFASAIIAFWVVTISLDTSSEKPFTLLQQYMSGNFSSELQSRNDSDYFDIRLRMEPIWNATDTEFYLYVEQAMSTALDKPYRQRIYRVVKESDERFVSYIYSMNAPQRFVGKSGNDAVFSSIKPDSLKALEGCEVRLSFNPKLNQFEGTTGERTCPSTRSGASYTTSKVVIGPKGMNSWDQGWSLAGVQVWGATKGGYEFIKQ
ncbi:MAG: chromophore lyase CpcT/CpeT [Flavobacteriales bacterium]